MHQGADPVVWRRRAAVGRHDLHAQRLAAERSADSMGCVGLDAAPARFPGAWKVDAGRFFVFCAAIVDPAHKLACAFKPQIACFAALRAEDPIERLITHIRRVAPEVPVILDAKRRDIGSTTAQYPPRPASATAPTH